MRKPSLQEVLRNILPQEAVKNIETIKPIKLSISGQNFPLSMMFFERSERQLISTENYVIIEKPHFLNGVELIITLFFIVWFTLAVPAILTTPNKSIPEVLFVSVWFLLVSSSFFLAYIKKKKRLDTIILRKEWVQSQNDGDVRTLIVQIPRRGSVELVSYTKNEFPYFFEKESKNYFSSATIKFSFKISTSHPQN